MAIGRSVRKYIDDDIDDFGVAAQKAESARHIHQHGQPKICQTCNGTGLYQSKDMVKVTVKCGRCNGTGKLQA